MIHFAPSPPLHTRQATLPLLPPRSSTDHARPGLTALTPSQVEQAFDKQIGDVMRLIERRRAALGLKPFGKPRLELPPPSALPFGADPANIVGYVIGDATIIHINVRSDYIREAKSPRALFHVFLHEALHCVSAGYDDALALENSRPHSRLNLTLEGTDLYQILSEGITDWLARHLGHAPANAYPVERKWAAELVKRVGLATVEKAFFTGDAKALGKMIDALAALAIARSRRRADASSPDARA